VDIFQRLGFQGGDSMMDLNSLIIQSFALILPAYIANSVPVLSRGKHPLDFGRCMSDGRRILGDGKTFEGLLFGLFFGTLAGILGGLLIGEIAYFALLSFMLALGALVGDMVGAFIKRRLGIARGAPAPVLDQLDFVIGALLFVSPFYPLALEQILFIILVTPPIHLFMNFMAYKLGLKPNPW
jgi:CDP-2,3-bis-(O-geranylgeranyl)-sn-glycerol synthase